MECRRSGRIGRQLEEVERRSLRVVRHDVWTLIMDDVSSSWGSWSARSSMYGANVKVMDGNRRPYTAAAARRSGAFSYVKQGFFGQRARYASVSAPNVLDSSLAPFWRESGAARTDGDEDRWKKSYASSLRANKPPVSGDKHCMREDYQRLTPWVSPVRSPNFASPTSEAEQHACHREQASCLPCEKPSRVCFSKMVMPQPSRHNVSSNLQ